MIWEDKDPKCPRDAKPVSSTQIVEGTRLLNNRDLASPDRDSAYPHLNLSIPPSRFSNFHSRDGNRSGRPASVGSTGIGRVNQPGGLPVGSRFFDQPVKSVEKPVKLSFLATKRHLSTN